MLHATAFQKLIIHQAYLCGGVLASNKYFFNYQVNFSDDTETQKTYQYVCLLHSLTMSHNEFFASTYFSEKLVNFRLYNRK